MPKPENAAGNESGQTTLISGGAKQPIFNNPSEINIDASSENLSAKYKYPRVSEDIPDAARNQYQ